MSEELMVSSMEAPCNVLGMIHRLFRDFLLSLLLANFNGIHLMSWQTGKPGEGRRSCSPALRDGIRGV